MPCSIRLLHSLSLRLTDEQVNAYITMLASTAGIKEKIAPASIYDFSPTEAAIRELATKK